MAVVAMWTWPSRICTTRGIDAVFEQSRRIAVAQRVRRDSPLDPHRAGGILEGAAQHLLIGRCARTIGE